VKIDQTTRRTLQLRAFADSPTRSVSLSSPLAARALNRSRPRPRPRSSRDFEDEDEDEDDPLSTVRANNLKALTNLR
jgi:hypothetical protein